MAWRKELVEHIKSEFEDLKSKNDKFSLRSYAAALELSPAALSQILRGQHKWQLTADRGAKILDKLHVRESDKNRLLTLMGLTPERNRKQIRPEDYDVLLDDTYLALLAAFDLPREERTIDKLSQRFGLKREEIERRHSELLKRGYLQQAEDNQEIERTPIHWDSGDCSIDPVVCKAHQKSVKVVRSLMSQLPPEEQHFSAISFVGSLDQLEAVKSEIQSFQERITNLMNHGARNDEVFKFSISLVPLRNLPTDPPEIRPSSEPKNVTL